MNIVLKVPVSTPVSEPTNINIADIREHTKVPTNISTPLIVKEVRKWIP